MGKPTIEELDARLRLVEKRVADLARRERSAEAMPARVCADCGQPEHDHTGVRHPFRSLGDA